MERKERDGTWVEYSKAQLKSDAYSEDIEIHIATEFVGFDYLSFKKLLLEEAKYEYQTLGRQVVGIEVRHPLLNRCMFKLVDVHEEEC